MAEKPFLTTQWLNIAMLNYQVDPIVLLHLVPHGTELDQFQGNTFISMVAFHYVDTRVLGFAVPWHRNFTEVNLRFYVRRRGPEGWRRGVVFLKEIVALPTVAWIARAKYEENFVALPMKYHVEAKGVRSATYQWKFQGAWQRIAARGQGQPYLPLLGSEEQFIAEHYWGYTRRRDGSTSEYRVEHPPWRVWTVSDPEFVCNVAQLYGPEFAESLGGPPSSAFLAEGSPVSVYLGQRIAG